MKRRAVFILALLAPTATWAQGADIRAQLSPRDFTTLAAEIGAKVEKIGAREGDRFTKGQVLIGFDCTVNRAQLDEARATQSAADKTLAVNRRLLELQTIGKLENDVSVAEAEKSRAKVAAMAAMVSKCAVAAPFGGRVVEQKVRGQQYVQPGQALLDILDDSVLELDFVVPSKWLVWLKPGAAFQVAMDETARTYPVKLTRIGARIDPVSQTVKVTGAIGGHFPELSAGMSGKVLLVPP
ncbi:MAG: efflux RND transporter periplasmic adaptor subunit [Magnetospirillum sp.]|nr:MAG: efflux RND transporter periplasmic adaptor subunit [Magnetospirillum sp.]